MGLEVPNSNLNKDVMTSDTVQSNNAIDLGKNMDNSDCEEVLFGSNDSVHGGSGSGQEKNVIIGQQKEQDAVLTSNSFEPIAAGSDFSSTLETLYRMTKTWSK